MAKNDGSKLVILVRLGQQNLDILFSFSEFVEIFDESFAINIDGDIGDSSTNRFRLDLNKMKINKKYKIDYDVTKLEAEKDKENNLIIPVKGNVEATAKYGRLRIEHIVDEKAYAPCFTMIDQIGRFRLRKVSDVIQKKSINEVFKQDQRRSSEVRQNVSKLVEKNVKLRVKGRKP